MLTSASSFRRVVTETTLTISRRTGEVNRNKNHGDQPPGVPDRSDPVQTEIISGWNAAAGPIANRVVGTITADLTRSPSRDTESTLANRIADTQLAATAAADGGSHIASMNLGRVRADLTFSQISGGATRRGDTRRAFAVQPFGNLLVAMDLTGEHIEQLLEQQAVSGRPGGRDVLIFGISQGFTFAYNPEGPFGDRINPASTQLNGSTLDPAPGGATRDQPAAIAKVSAEWYQLGSTLDSSC